ncbi:hypothetical protein BV20DRAFT_945764, partial [Pilatotrama ljubarskyi]
TRQMSKMQKDAQMARAPTSVVVPFGVTYEKIGTIQRRLAWPLHKDDTLSRSGRPTGLNIYASFCPRIRSKLKCGLLSHRKCKDGGRTRE